MSSLEKRSKVLIRIDAAQRLAMWHRFSGVTPFLRVSEYPKSGGTWLGQILSSYFEIPFPRNRRPAIAKLQPCLLHGHHVYAKHVEKIVCILRDGRDVMVSAYYHMLHHHRDSHLGDPVHKALPSDDYRNVELNMAAFIEYMFTRPTLGGMRFARGKVSWRTFTESWLDQGANLVSYESMLLDTPNALAPVIGKLTGEEPDVDKLASIAEQYSFRNQTNRRAGIEDANSFLRKGIAGDWKEKFTPEACEVFKYYAGDTLIRAGYEMDSGWTTAPKASEDYAAVKAKNCSKLALAR